MPQETDTKQALREYVNGLGLTYTATFQPRPQPRETVEHPQLHWLITLSNGKQSAQFPYSEGCGHVTGYKAFHATRYDTAQADARYRKACETGLVQVTEFARPIPHEEWASEYGYDEDSRKEEETYRACQKQTTYLLRVLGAGTVGRKALDVLETLETLFQDY